MHPLAGSQAKLRWANANLDALKREVAAFFGDASNPESLRGHLEAKELRGLPTRRAEPQWHWPLLIGDIIHSYRSSLDYLAWELARLQLRRVGKTRCPSKRTAFPLVRNPADWPRVAGSQLAEIGEDERGMIEGFQPYHSDLGADHPLIRLSALSNRDKHQTLNLVLVEAGAVDISLEKSFSGWAALTSSHPRRATIQDPTGKTKAELQLKTMFQVAFDDGNRIDSVLDGIGPVVARIVGTFEASFEDA